MLGGGLLLARKRIGHLGLGALGHLHPHAVPVVPAPDVPLIGHLANLLLGSHLGRRCRGEDDSGGHLPRPVYRPSGATMVTGVILSAIRALLLCSRPPADRGGGEGGRRGGFPGPRSRVGRNLRRPLLTVARSLIL